MYNIARYLINVLYLHSHMYITLISKLVDRLLLTSQNNNGAVRQQRVICVASVVCARGCANYRQLKIICYTYKNVNCTQIIRNCNVSVLLNYQSFNLSHNAFLVFHVGVVIIVAVVLLVCYRPTCNCCKPQSKCTEKEKLINAIVKTCVTKHNNHPVALYTLCKKSAILY